MTSSGAGCPVHSVNDGGALVEQHQLAVGRRAAGAPRRRAGAASGRRSGRAPGGPAAGSRRAPATRPSIRPIEVALTSTFAFASSASMIDSCQGIARRSMWAALRPKCLTRHSAAVQVAVEHDDPLEALADQAVDHGPRTAAGAQHHRVARHLLAAHELVEGDP